jgi:hypothetical protein
MCVVRAWLSEELSRKVGDCAGVWVEEVGTSSELREEAIVMSLNSCLSIDRFGCWSEMDLSGLETQDDEQEEPKDEDQEVGVKVSVIK